MRATAVAIARAKDRLTDCNSAARQVGLVTGITRDGTFLIENCEIVAGVRNMRFNESIMEALCHCEFSNDPRRTGGYFYSVVVPTLTLPTHRPRNQGLINLRLLSTHRGLTAPSSWTDRNFFVGLMKWHPEAVEGR
jgi:hypothetical protein